MSIVHGLLAGSVVLKILSEFQGSGSGLLLRLGEFHQSQRSEPLLIVFEYRQAYEALLLFNNDNFNSRFFDVFYARLLDGVQRVGRIFREHQNGRPRLVVYMPRWSSRDGLDPRRLVANCQLLLALRRGVPAVFDESSAAVERIRYVGLLVVYREPLVDVDSVDAGDRRRIPVNLPRQRARRVENKLLGVGFNAARHCVSRHEVPRQLMTVEVNLLKKSYIF